MMEAKDTLKFNLGDGNKLRYLGDLNKSVIEMLEAQAETSFKAGQDSKQEEIDWCHEALDWREAEITLAYKEGIQEVGEWLQTKLEEAYWQSNLIEVSDVEALKRGEIPRRGKNAKVGN